MFPRRHCIRGLFKDIGSVKDLREAVKVRQRPPAWRSPNGWSCRRVLPVVLRRTPPSCKSCLLRKCAHSSFCVAPQGSQPCVAAVKPPLRKLFPCYAMAVAMQWIPPAAAILTRLPSCRASLARVRHALSCSSLSVGWLRMALAMYLIPPAASILTQLSA